MLRILKPNPGNMSFVNKDRNSYNIKEDIWRSEMSGGVGHWIMFEVDMDNKLGVKKKSELYFGVNSEGHLYGGVRIELVEGINIDHVEYAVRLALKKPGSESYGSPLMMKEPSEGFVKLKPKSVVFSPLALRLRKL